MRRSSTTEEILDKNIEPIPESGCWLWTGAASGDGYGRWTRTRHGAPGLRAHRVVYELFRGPIPGGLPLDHLCRVIRCVNPAHLEAVPIRVNTLRGIGFPAMKARQTHCVNGHEFDSANTYIRSDGRYGRMCRACDAARHRAKKEADREAPR